MNSINSSNFPIFTTDFQMIVAHFPFEFYFHFFPFLSFSILKTMQRNKNGNSHYAAVAIAIAMAKYNCALLGIKRKHNKLEAAQRYFCIKNNFLSLFECLCLYVGRAGERAGGRERFFALHWKCALIASFCARNLPVNEVECTFSSCCLY